MRIEPPPSVPSANGKRPSATAAALPPEEPPLLRARSNGLRVGPNSGLSQVPRKPMTGLLVLPSRIAPACSMRSANAQWKSATKSLSARTPPKVLFQPGLKSNRSFSAQGTPCRGPSSAPDISACSAARARALASSKPKWTKAFRLGLRASIRAMKASTTSTGDSSRRRIRNASSVALA